MKELIKENIHFRVGTDDEIIIREIIEEDMYCFQLLKSLFIHYPTPMAFIDIGAHIGIFSLQWHQLVDQASIYCIEPDSENFSLLQKNCHTPGFHLYNFAVSAKNGIGALRLENPQHTGRWRMEMNNELQHSATESVIQVKSINSFLENIIEPDLILKIDIEGGEYELIHAMSSSHWDRVQILFIEWHDQPIPEVFFQDLGFSRLFHPKLQRRHDVFIRQQINSVWIDHVLSTQMSILSKQHHQILEKAQIENQLTLKNLMRKARRRLKNLLT